MKIIKEYKIIVITFLVIVLSIFAFINQRFSVKYKICDALYEKCFTFAKFKDFDDCELIKERNGWYCDSSDTNNISCRKAKTNETSAVGVCTK